MLGMTGRPVSLGVRAFQGRWVPRVGWMVSDWLGEGVPKSLPGLGYLVCPAPGGVDA